MCILLSARHSKHTFDWFNDIYRAHEGFHWPDEEEDEDLKPWKDGPPKMPEDIFQAMFDAGMEVDPAHLKGREKGKGKASEQEETGTDKGKGEKQRQAHITFTYCHFSDIITRSTSVQPNSRSQSKPISSDFSLS